MSKIFCTNCGQELNVGNKFCPKCGTAVTVPSDTQNVLVEEACVQETACAVETVPEQREIPVPQEETPVVVPATEQAQTVPVTEQTHEKKEKKVKAEKKPKSGGFVARELAAKSAKGKVWRALISILLCIMIFASALMAIITFAVRKFTEEEKVIEAIESFELDSVAAGDVIDLEGQIIEDSKGKEYEAEYLSLAEYICIQLDYRYQGEIDINAKKLNGYFEESGLKSFFAEKMASYMNDIYEGEGTTSISKNRIEKLLKESDDIIREKYDVVVEEWIYEDAAEWIDDMDIDEKIGVRGLKRNEPAVYYLMNIGLSYYMIIVHALLALLFAYLLLVVNKMSFIGMLRGFGISMLISGGVYAALTVVAVLFTDLWESVCGGFGVVAALAGDLLGAGILVALGILLVGIVLIVVSAILSSVVKKRAKAVVAAV